MNSNPKDPIMDALEHREIKEAREELLWELATDDLDGIAEWEELSEVRLATAGQDMLAAYVKWWEQENEADEPDWAEGPY